MGIKEELERQGYEFEYERTVGGDRRQVWTNKEAGMAIRIEWLKIDQVEP